MNSGFWKNRRVFVTGHTGFKGSWLCLWLQTLGARVTGYALEPPTQPNLFTLARVADGMDESLCGDVRDLPALSVAIGATKPDIVIHMAAQSLVRASYQQPVDTFATNVMGTVNVLEAARQCKSVKAVIVVTSDKCYENREWIWGYRENDPMGGHDPYSASKGCAELVVSAYRRSFLAGGIVGRGTVGIASVRAGNVVGGGDWSPDRLVPDFFRAVLARRKLRVRAPLATRPWQHVLEPLSGYLMLAERLRDDPATFSGAWNFGPDADAVQPVGEVTNRLVRLWGRGAGWRAASDGAAPHEAGWLALDSSKAWFHLGWRPRLSLGEALELTVRWYRAYIRRGDLRRVTLAQIQRYAAS